MQFIQTLSSWLTKIPWSGLNWDIALILGLITLSFLYTIILGRQRVFLILVSIYVSLAVLAYTPIVGRISDLSASSGKIYFGIGFFILFFLLVRGVLGHIFAKGGCVSNWWWFFFLAFLQLGLITSIVFSFLSKEVLQIFSPFVKNIFLNEWSRFGWLFVPIFVMAALDRSKKNDF